LGRIVGDATKKTFHQWAWDRGAVFALLGQPISCHRILITAADGVVGGLILAYLFTSLRRDLVNGGDGERIHIPVAHTRAAIGITEKQQRLARERLRSAGLIEETFEQRAQPRLLTRLDLVLLSHKCAEIISNNNSLHVSCTQDCSFTQTRVALSANLELPKTQIKGSPMREPGVALSANLAVQKGQLSISIENIKQLQRAGTPVETLSANGSSSGVEIILPAKLGQDEVLQALAWLSPLADDLKQQVADEWAGLLDLSDRGVKQVHNRFGLLRKLVKSAQGLDQSPFIPTLALDVAAARKRRQEIEDARNKTREEVMTTQTEDGTKAGREGLRQTMNQLWGRSA
jgi:hypothetical protein